MLQKIAAGKRTVQVRPDPTGKQTTRGFYGKSSDLQNGGARGRGMISKPGQSPAVEGAPTDPELARWLPLPPLVRWVFHF